MIKITSILEHYDKALEMRQLLAVQIINLVLVDIVDNKLYVLEQAY